MKKEFSLYTQLNQNKRTLEQIDECIKVTLGPTGKNGIVSNKHANLKIITNGSILLKALEFSNYSGNILLRLFEQAATKTYNVAGDGSTLTTLFSCQLLSSSLGLLTAGYNPYFLGNGMKKLSYVLMEKILEYSTPISTVENLKGIVKTCLGQSVGIDIFSLLQNCVEQIGRDGLILVEENIVPENNIELIQGIELDRGFASSYFVNDFKNFEVIYDNPYILITNYPLKSLNQIRDIIEHIQANNRPLVIVAEEIDKDVLSALVLNTIQKKIKVVVIKYSSIKFIKNGLLDDLALLTHANYFDSKLKNTDVIFGVQDLGQAKKVMIKKDKSTFIVSKFVKLLITRRINELNRELLSSDSEYEKNILQTRIARLSGHIAKIKLGVSNQYEIDELRQRVEAVILTLKSTLEEGFLPGGGSFYSQLDHEISNWSYANLIGEEVLAVAVLKSAFPRPIEELFLNTNTSTTKIFSELERLGYPHAYDVLNKKIVNAIDYGLIDSSKAIRGTLWNSLTMVSTIITSK